MDKRNFIKSIALASAGVFVTGFFNKLKASKSRNSWDGIFRLPELPYSFNALEPHIDSETMKLQYSQQGLFTEKLNIAVKEAGLSGKNAFALMKEMSKFNDDIRNNCGGFFNHKFFWQVLTPVKNKKPSDQFMSGIIKDFGSFDAFKDAFSDQAKTVFGSGWAWLVVDNKGKLVVTSTYNHDNPIMDISKTRGMPILCLDVWEHAYYMKNQDRRTDYIDSFWNVVNWDIVSQNYTRIIKRGIII